VLKWVMRYRSWIEVLSYKQEGGGFNSRQLVSATIFMEWTQPVREMSTRELPCVKERPACKSGNLMSICEPTV
jgi:hypothetical protein